MPTRPLLPAATAMCIATMPVGRCIERRFPGRAPEYSVYDRGDRLVMSQDGNLRSKKQWLLYTYDAFNRPSSQRLATDTSTADQAQRHAAFCNAFDGGTAPALYTGSSTTVREWVYDRYNGASMSGLAFTDNDLTLDGGVSLRDVSVCGLPVGEKLAVLSDDGVSGYHERAFYYDYRGREIQRVEKAARGGVLRTTSRYDLAGNVLAQRESYIHDGTTDELNRTFEYDSRNRMTKETAQFNGGEQAVVSYTYDDLGQLTGKTYGTGSTPSTRRWITICRDGSLRSPASCSTCSCGITSCIAMDSSPPTRAISSIGNGRICE